MNALLRKNPLVKKTQPMLSVQRKPFVLEKEMLSLRLRRERLQQDEEKEIKEKVGRPTNYFKKI